MTEFTKLVNYRKDSHLSIKDDGGNKHNITTGAPKCRLRQNWAVRISGRFSLHARSHARLWYTIGCDTDSLT